MTDVRAITIREPWASAITAGAKTIENRASGTTWRGTLLIHTSLQQDTAAAVSPLIQHALWGRFDLSAAEVFQRMSELDGGVIIAVAALVDVHDADTIPTLTGGSGTCCEPWGERLHGTRQAKHLVLADVRRLATPVPARGALGLWKPTAELIAQVSRETTWAGAR